MNQCLPTVAAQRGPARRLLRSLIEMAGPDATALCSETTPWASALYDGMVCYVTLDLIGMDAAAQAEDMARRLPDAEFSISGFIVGDVAVESSLAVDAQTHSLNLAVLMIAEGGV